MSGHRQIAGKRAAVRLLSVFAALLCLISALPGRAQDADAYSSSVIEAAIRTELGLSDEEALTWDMLTEVKTLVLDCVGVTDVSYLSMCPNLEVLYLDGNAIEDISVVASMKKLRVFSARNNMIRDISALSGLDQLEEVHLASNRVSDLGPLRGKQNLKTLVLDDNPITDIEPIGDVCALTYLSMYDTTPSDFGPLSELTNLEYLDLSHTAIQDLSVLENMHSLRDLFLGGNAIADVTPLGGLTSLKTLNLLANAKIADTSALLALSLENYEGPPIEESPTEPVVDAPTVEAASSAAEARNGVVRILTLDDLDQPTYFSTGSGFGVGVIGQETDIFITNRHVVYDEGAGRISDHVYIMLDDNAAKRVYSSFGDFLDEESGAAFKLVLSESHMVKCDVLYPTDSDPAFPDFAILRAARPVEGRVALALKSTEEVPDTTPVWTIGYPGSADKLYNLDSLWEEMKYEADVEGSQLFSGIISRRGSMKSLGDTMAVTHGAQIDHGNSGGPLVIEDGEVIGINTYGFESSQTTSVGYYMSIYIDYAMAKMDELGIGYNLTEPMDATGSDAPQDAGPDDGSASDGDVSRPAVHRQTESLLTEYISYEDGVMKYDTEYTYNEYGDRTGYISFNPNGSMRNRREMEYDDWGHMIVDRTFDENNALEEWTEYYYTDENVYLGYKVFSADGEVKGFNECQYDEDGYLVGEISKSSYSSDITYVYYRNPDGSERKHIAYKDGSVWYSEEYEYDDAGRRIAHLRLNGDGTMDYLYEYQYDDRGNEILHARYEEDGLKSWVECAYDDADRKVGEVLYSGDGSILYYSMTDYDEYGNTISSSQYDVDGSLDTYSDYDRQYDADGNMTYSKYSYKGVISGESFYTPTEIWVREDGGE